MGVPGSANPLLLAQQDTGYRVQRSIRLNSSDSAFLSRTPSSAGNRKTWTFSCWVKRSGLGNATGSFQNLFSSQSAFSGVRFNTSDQIEVFEFSGGYVWTATTTAVFRDPSAWYHVVFAYDTTQATAADRIKLYVNSVQQVFGSPSYPAQNRDGGVNSTVFHTVGASANTTPTEYFSGYLAEIHFIDGQALTPSSFAETNATTGQWVPKAFSGGSYGTNGFKLDFSDNSAATAAALGKDTSPNGNNWTPNNLSVAAGAGNDSLADTPTSYGTDTSVGGEVRGNYATLNPLVNFNSSTLTNSNLDITCASVSAQWRTQKGGWGFYGGKFYFEATLNAGGSAGNSGIGIGRITLPHSGNAYPGQSAGSYAYTSDGGKIDSGSASYPWATWTVNDVIGVATDLTAGTVAFYKNGTLQGSMTGLDTTLTYEVLVGSASSTASQYSLNFGQRPFAYPVSGFKALVDTNIPVVIAKPSTVFDTKLYTGNGSTQSITGLGFSPDLVWIKMRSKAYWHELNDSVRGPNKSLFSNATDAESTINTLTAFNSDGFTVGVNGGANGGTNENLGTYVAWAWDAGSSNATNTQGSITSSVRANASAGFSVVTYVGTGGTGGTVGHGLGAAPSLIIAKSRSASRDWIVYHKDLSKDKYINLNTTGGASSTTSVWGSAEPTSSVFGVYAWSTAMNNANGENMVAYCFAPVSGYSSFGSYVGTANADGPMVWLGFRPRWILFKNTSVGVEDWWLHDTARNTYNVMTSLLVPNSANAEGTNAAHSVDALSNGFKIRTTAQGVNGSGHTIVYAAFAEAPFQYARAR